MFTFIYIFPDGKKMIISQDTNGTPMIIGTIEATPATPSPPPPASPVPTGSSVQATSTASGTIVALVGSAHSPANSPRPLVNGQVNGNSSTASSSSSPESPSNSTSPAPSTSALSPTTHSELKFRKKSIYAGQKTHFFIFSKVQKHIF